MRQQTIACEETTAVPDQIEELAISHGMPCGSKRSLLQPRHVKEFSGESLFHRLARTVCAADAIPRKELFEAWAVALYVRRTFPAARRIADLACSHGLASWALLLLYDNPDVSAVCVDVRMPPSAEKLAAAMLEQWPEFKGRWDYVEGSVDGIVPCSSTLLVGVHACARLSDSLISMATHANSSLALVPCCHSKQCLPPEERKRMTSAKKIPNLAELIDNYRIRRLEAAGMTVQEVWIPETITPKNRVLLASPSLTSTAASPGMTRWNPSKLKSKLSIPIGDTNDAKATIKSLAGREAADRRKVPPPQTLGLCLFLPPNEDISAQQLEAIIKESVVVTAINDFDPHFDKASGRHTRTFRITYQLISSKQRAKEAHIELCREIPDAFPGAEPRQIPR